MTDEGAGSSRPLVHDRNNHIVSSSQPLFNVGLGELSAHYDVLFCDVWGVVHDGVSPHRAAVDALQRFRAQGGKVILMSNAPAPAGSVRHRLDRIGVARKAYDAIITSGDVIASMIAARGDAPLYNIGPSYDRPLYEAARKISGHLPRRTKLENASYVVCTGLFDPDTETPADYDPALAKMRQRELDFLCANPDIVVHVGPKLMYCAGAIAERYEALGGNVIQGGKPHPPIYARAFEIADALLGRPVARSRVLVIGDAMRTDVKGAVAQSLDSLFIASGIHRDTISKADLEGDRKAALRLIEETGLVPFAVSFRLEW